MSIRNEVQSFALLGRLPSESEDEDVIARHQAALKRIARPVTASAIRGPNFVLLDKKGKTLASVPMDDATLP